MEENLNPSEEVQQEVPQSMSSTAENPVQASAQVPQGQPQFDNQPCQQPYQQPYYPACPKPVSSKRNPMGTAGFILGTASFVLFMVPYMRFILAVLGLTFSVVGLFRKNSRKALAIAGGILALLTLFIILVIWLHFDYSLSDIFDDDFVEMLNFLDK